MSDAGQAIGTAVGAVIGFFVGGVGGAVRGAALGYSLTAPRQKEQSPTYSFGFKYNTASQTIPVPVVYGKNLVAGNSLYKRISGTNNEKMALQISVSEGPVQSVTAIKADDVDITSRSRVKLGNRIQSADTINEHSQTFPLTAYISTELTANENLSGSPAITSIVEGRKIAVWNGSSWVEQYSQNPAFVILDFLKNPIYGLGWVDEDIDLDSFINAAAYCDGLVDDGLGGQEKRFQLDYVIDFQQASPDHIVDILMTFRAFLTYNQGMISLNIDGPNEVPAQDFDMNNIVEGSLVYREAKKDERLNKVIVNFTDEEDNFEVQGVYASMDGDIKRRGLIDDTFNLHGLNRRTQAGRMAHYFQRKTFFDTTTVEFRAGVDSIHCEAGNVVRITHDVPGWNQKWFRILYIKEYQNDEMIIYAQNYNKMVYDDSGVVQQVKRDTTLPNPFDSPASVVNLSLIEHNKVLGDGTWVPGIKVTWDKPNDIFWRAGNIWISFDNGATWGFVQSVEDDEYLISNLAPDEYKVKVQSENDKRRKEDFGTAAVGSITIVGKDINPADCTWGPCSFEKNIILTWQDIPDQDKDYFEVRIDGNFGSNDAGLIFRGKTLKYEMVPKQRSYTFYLRAKDKSGNYSTNSAVITLNNTIPIAPPQPVISEFFTALWIEAEANGESDIIKYRLYLTPSDGAGNPTGGPIKTHDFITAPQKITIEASPGTYFLIEISAFDALGEGPKSAPVEATTKHVEAPDIPDGLLTESKLENSLKSKIDSAKSNSDNYANQVIAYPTEENGLLTELTGNDYLLKYSAGDVYVGAEIEIDPNGFFDLTDQTDNELTDSNGDTVTITDIQDELGNSLLGPGTPTWYGSNMGEKIHLIVSNSPAVDFKVLYGVKKNLSGLSVDAMLKRGVTAKQIDANVVDSIEAMRGFPWNEPVPTDKTLLGVETRVTSNESGISSNQTSISQNATDIQTNATKITAAENNITANQTSIQQNADGINVNAAKIQTNENDISANSASIQVNADSIAANVTSMKEYVQSRGENLITNGSGLLGDNTNFSSFEFDGSDAYGCAGSFKATGKHTYFNDELMPVNPDLKYKLSTFAKANPYMGAKHYLGITCYDVDKLEIAASHHMYIADTLTTLAQDLKDGDTVVYLTDATNWINSAGASTHKRRMIFWDYQNSYGYQYPPETYSRHTSGYDTWADGAVNYTTNSITLNSPWSGGLISAGTQLSNGSSGGTYKYIAMSATIVPDQWTEYDGLIGEIDYSGQNIYTKFTPGTAYVKLLFLTDYYSNGGTIWFSNFSFAVDVAKQGDLDTANTNLSNLDIRVTENEADIQINSDSIISTVHELHSSKWQDLFTAWDGSEWICHEGNPAITVVDEPTSINGKVLQVEGFGWYSLNENIPFDPESMYILKIRARQVAEGIGETKIYCGVNGVAANGVTLINISGYNSYSSQHYITVSGYTLTMADGWKEWTGFIQGYSTSAGWPHNNPQDPGKMYPGVTFIRPMFIVNYNGGTGIAQIDYMILKLDSKESWSQVNQLANEYTVKLQQHANGQDYIAGFGLAIDGGISEFGILADRFKIYGNPDDPGETATPVFALDTQTNKLYLLADLIADGTITARMLTTSELITLSAQIKDGIIDNAKIINVEANKITTNEAKIQSAQIESIQAEQIKVGGQPAQLVNPKPQGARLWHFDRSAISTDGLAPESNAVYTLRPGEGKYGGAVAMEEGTTNLSFNPLFVNTSKWGLTTNGASTFTTSDNWGKINIPVGESGKWHYLEQTIVVTTPANTKVTFSMTFKNNAAGRFALRLVLFEGTLALEAVQVVNLDGSGIPKRYSVTAVHTANSDKIRIDVLAGSHYTVGGGLSDSDVEFSYAQLEQKPFATSFVNGTRTGGSLSYQPFINWNNFTMAGWTKIYIQQGTHQPIITVCSSAHQNNRFLFMIEAAGTNLNLWYGNDSVNTNIGGINYTPAIGEWFFWAITFDGFSYKIYINGELIKVKDDPTVIKLLPGATLNFGGKYWGHLNGLIDEALIIPYAASDEQIKAWYNAQAPFFDNAPVQTAGSITMTHKGMQIKGTDGIEIIGQTGDRAVLNEDLLAFYRAGSNVPHWYTKQVAHGTAQDGDYITLNWGKKPKVIVAVKDLRSYTYSQSGQNYSNSNQNFYAYAPESEITENGFRVLCRGIVQGAENFWDIPDQILMDGVEWPSDYTPIATTTKMQIGLKLWHSSGSYASMGASRILWYYQKEGQSSWTYHGSGVSNPRGNFLFTSSTSTYTIDGLPSGKYRWKVRATGAHDGEFRTRIQWWKYQGDVVIDIGTATWIAIEGGAD